MCALVQYVWWVHLLSITVREISIVTASLICCALVKNVWWCALCARAYVPATMPGLVRQSGERECVRVRERVCVCERERARLIQPIIWSVIQSLSPTLPSHVCIVRERVSEALYERERKRDGVCMCVCERERASRVYTGWFAALGTQCVQGGKDPSDALSCRSFCAKKPLFIGLFCDKWPILYRKGMLWVFAPLYAVRLSLRVSLCQRESDSVCVYTRGCVCVRESTLASCSRKERESVCMCVRGRERAYRVAKTDRMP